MNPSSPTFLSKPSIHDQLRNMSVKLNEGSFKDFDEGNVRILDRITKYNKLEGVKTGVTVEKNEVTGDDDVFYDTKKVSSFLEKREKELNKPSSLPRANKIIPNFVVRVGSEMRPRSRQIEEDLKSLEKKNQKTELGRVIALEANNRLLREIMDSENIMQRNREEIKRLRSELDATSFDKSNFLEKLDQAEKDLKKYEEEVVKASRAIGEMTASAANKIIKEDKKLKPEQKQEDNKRKDGVGFISATEAEEIRNKIVSDLKVKLLEVKSVEELDYYVALEQDKLRDIAESKNIKLKNVDDFYHDMTQGRIKNTDGRVGASFDFLVNRKREELIKEKLNPKKKVGKAFSSSKADKKIPIDVDDAYMDWKYSKQNYVSEEIADYNRKKAAGFAPDKNPTSKIEEELEPDQASTPIISDAPVVEVLPEDAAATSKLKSPRITKPKFNEGDIWMTAEMTRLQDQKDLEKANQESEKAMIEEKLKLDEKINALRASFEDEMNRKNEEIRKKEEDLIRIQAALETEKNKNLIATVPINQSAPRTPQVTDIAPKIQPINLDEIIEKLKLKKEIKLATNNTNTAPASHAPATPTYIRPNTKRLEEKTGKVGLRSAILTAVFAGLMAAGGGYVYGEKIGSEKTTETLIANFNAEKIKDAEAATKKAEEIVVDSYNKGYEKSKMDAAENLLTKEATPESQVTSPAKIEKNTAKPEQKTETPKSEAKLEAKPQEPAKKLEWTNKASVSPKPEAQSLNTAPVKSSVDFSSLAGADNKSVEVKRTEKGTVYKLADYGIEGVNKDGIEYIANPISKSVERRNNFCNLKSAESKSFLGFNSLQDAATACLHQLWRYQSGNNKVGLSAESSLGDMLSKYANLNREINEDSFDNYMKIIQKTYKDYGVKVNVDTKLASLDMSKMLEAISIAENKFYAFDAKSMTVNLKSGVKQEMLSSAGDIMNNGPESKADNYAINNYGQAKYHFEYNPFMIKTA